MNTNAIFISRCDRTFQGDDGKNITYTRVYYLEEPGGAPIEAKPARNAVIKNLPPGTPCVLQFDVQGYQGKTQLVLRAVAPAKGS